MKEYNKALHNATVVVNALMKKTFRHIYVEMPASFLKHPNAYPTMAVCSHRSHLDYVLLGIELHNAGIKNLRFAAGDNLINMPYVGPKFRSYGAFPVYRARALSRKYIQELCEQVISMLFDGENVIVFPEGGRSYNGNMMDMKNGIIGASVLAQYRRPNYRFVYLPVTISYEKLPELLYFNKLHKGKELRRKKNNALSKIKGNLFYYGADIVAFSKFIAAHKFKKEYGDVFIDCGEPIAVNDIVDVNKNYTYNCRNELSGHKMSIQKVGLEIRGCLLQLYRILPMHIIAAILNKSGACSKEDAVAMVPAIFTELERKRRNCKSLVSLSEKEIVEKGIYQLEYSKAVKAKGNRLEIRNKKMIKYYAVSIE